MGTVPRLIPALLLCLAVAMAAAACGGGGGGEVADADSIDLSATVAGDGWKVNLADAPEKHLILGKGNITYQAEDGNIYLVVFLELANTGTVLKVVDRSLLQVRDGAGTEYGASISAHQVAYLEQDGSKEGYSIVLDSPLQPGKSRRGVVTFLVPDSATGLQLMFKGFDDTIDIGF